VKTKFLNEVESTLFERHISFLSNPLLITVMLLTYGDSVDVPKKMHLFYEQAYVTLFYRHDSWKEVGFQRKHFCPLLMDEFSNVLSTFCITSYRRLRFEFTISSALELIKKAAKFERLELDASAFLRDLTESVCILQLDGVNYRFTHRSFQEYFAAVFISRAPPIELSNLLDILASRRGDLVIPMAMETNPSLIEREWILPRLKMIKPSQVDAIGALKFATETFGPLVFSIGSLLQREQISQSSSHNTSTKLHDSLYTPKLYNFLYTFDFLYTLEQLYPGCLDAHIGIFDCTSDDLISVERFGVHLFEKWWTSNQSLRLQFIQELKDLERIRAIRHLERRLEFYSAKQKDYSVSSEMVPPMRVSPMRYFAQIYSSEIDFAQIYSSEMAPPMSDFAQIYFSELSELMQNNHQIDALDTLVYDRVRTKLAEKIKNAISRRPKINPDVYAEWFSSTTIAQKVVKLADQLASLYDVINSRFEFTKKIGTELLD